MAFNKNSTGYTLGFAIGLVTISGALLAFLSVSLKPAQTSNIENEKRAFILSSAGEFTMEESKAMTKDEIKKTYEDKIIGKVLDFNGEIVEGVNAFDIDIVKEFKSTKGRPEDRNFPCFTYSNGTSTKYIVGMAGNGLWGPVWAFIALDEDQNTVSNIVFDHKSETPGLGAEITAPSFISKFTKFPKRIVDENGKYKSIAIVKAGDASKPHEIDAIAGATITSKGVSNMLKESFMPYMLHWGKVKN